MEKSFQRAKKYLEQAQYEKAEEIFREIVEQYPESPYFRESLFLLGKICHRLWKMDEAIKVFETFVERYPQDDLLLHILWSLADCYEHFYKFDEAVKNYEQLLWKFPRYNQNVAPIALLRLGHCYLQLGKLSKALEAWESLEERFSSLGEIRKEARVIELLSEKIYRELGVLQAYDFLGTVSPPHLISLYSQMPEELPPFVRSRPKEPVLVGPMKEAGWLSLWGRTPSERGKLIFVYGTKGALEDNEATKKTALERKKWVEDKIGLPPEIKSDEEVGEEDIQDKHIYLFGNPNCNGFLNRIAEALPLKISEGTILLGDREYKGEKVGALLTVPNPLNPGKYLYIELAISPKDFFPSLKAVPCWNVDYAVLEATEPLNTLLEEGFLIKPDPACWKVLTKSGELG
ncbi:tetratricopeptide repeat protein [bacterium]|nr:tetratricopeptide repeat protein [bacterium]